jgi:hypothetical protein
MGLFRGFSDLAGVMDRPDQVGGRLQRAIQYAGAGADSREARDCMGLFRGIFVKRRGGDCMGSFREICRRCGDATAWG